MMRRVLFCLFFWGVTLCGGCGKSNYATSLRILNESSFTVGWTLTGGFVGGDGKDDTILFEGDRASSVTELISLIGRTSGVDTPLFTFYIMQTNNPEEYTSYEVGRVEVSDCNIAFTGTGGEGLLKDYIEIYSFVMRIDDVFLSNLAATSGGVLE